MQVFYVRRNPYELANWWEKFFKKLGQRFKNWFYFKDTGGFFRGSLHRTCSVTESKINYLQQQTSQSWLEENYDALVISQEATNPRVESDNISSLNFLNDLESITTVLLVDDPDPAYVPGNEVFDRFDLVFKRGPYKDTKRYELSEVNRNKIRPTMLHYRKLIPNRFNINRVDPRNYGQRKPADEFEHDVFFLGLDVGDWRRKTVQKLHQKDVEFYGGLYTSEQYEGEPPDHLTHEPLPYSEFLQAIRASRINVAAEHKGFSHRHLEIWAQDSFMVSSPAIDEIALPFEPEEGTHFVMYESVEELDEIVDYYLNHPDERRAIAKEGRSLFEEEYDFEKHGEYIKRQITKTADDPPVKF
ncbi:MAG: glycosyltransferase [bacterium]